MTGLFYVAMTIMIGIPTNLRLRPEDIPATLLVMALLPLVYATIFRVLNQQQELFEAKERHHMLQNGQSQEAMEYINNAQEILQETNVEHYCSHPVLDAILVAYFQRAKDMGIQVEAQLAIPNTLPVPAAELSTVFANALENMIHAVQTVPAEQRRIWCGYNIIICLDRRICGQIGILGHRQSSCQ